VFPAALFLIVFGISETASLMLPFEAADSTSAGTALHYLVSAGIVVTLVFSAYPAIRLQGRATTRGSSDRWFWVVEFLSFLGLFLLAVNTLVFKGISYQEGPQVARELMRANRSGPPDWTLGISLIGNLLVSGSFLAISAAVSLSNAQRHFSGVVLRQWVVIICFSLLVGGREPLWIGLGFMAGAVGVRLSSFRSAMPKRLKNLILATLLVAIVLSVWIAQLRIDRYEGRFDIVNFCRFLGGAAPDGIRTEVELPEAAAPLAAYLAHPRWLSIETFSSTEPSVGRATLRVASSSLSRVETLAWVHSEPPTFHGRWIPVAASLWYDMNWRGLLLLATICFALGRLYLSAVKKLARTSAPSTAAWGALYGCLCFSAPMQSAFESVPFVYATLLLAIISVCVHFAPPRKALICGVSGASRSSAHPCTASSF
jgi:hypothetical protein